MEVLEELLESVGGSFCGESVGVFIIGGGVLQGVLVDVC